MAEVNPPFALQNAGATHTAENDRMMLSGMLAGVYGVGGAQMGARGGVNPSAGFEFTVTQSGTPSMVLIVRSGVCYVAGTEGYTQGIYACTNDADKNVTVTTAHGTLPRIDSVVARVRDSAYSGATNAWALEVIAGTAASSPVAPTLPANCLKLYDVTVGAAVSSITNANLSDARPWATAAGGIIPVKNVAERDSVLSLVPNGQGVFRLDTGVVEFKHAGSFVPRSPQRPLYSSQSAEPPYNVTGVTIDFISGSFPAITFTSPPSGIVRVNIGGAVFNNNTTTSTAWLTYRMSGAITYQASEDGGLSAAGTRVYASRSRIISGMTPNASCTITPQWQISSGSGATAFIAGGQLSVELMP